MDNPNNNFCVAVSEVNKIRKQLDLYNLAGVETFATSTTPWTTSLTSADTFSSA
ncbi:hypothetical protein PV703_08175 [Streptomyces sp. ME01-24h]|nr:hypothetical protein [Streptomyces sp. ME01-24h]